MTKRAESATSSQDFSILTWEEERLFTAISFGKLHKVTALLPHLRHTEVRNDFHRTPLIHAARSARGEHANFLVKLLLQRGSDVNAQDEAGMTSLMHVVRQKSSVDALRALMRCKKCDPNVQDKDGNTALMYAAKFGNAEAIAILLFLPVALKHADVSVRNAEGLTALDLAVQERQPMCCHILVHDGGADSVRDTKMLNTLLRMGLKQRDPS